MKKLIIPLTIALLGGIGSGTGFTFIRESKAAAIEAERAKAVADSVKIVDEKKKADSVKAAEAAARETVDSILTPAESLRAVAASRTPLKDASRGLKDAVPLQATSTTDAAATRKSPAHTDKPATVTAKADSAAKQSAVDAAEVVRAARKDAMNTPLPEQRLAKIFSAMQAKDAARVLGQMEDRDIRSVLSLMGDRQAAAILSALTPERAAAITKGALANHGADK